MEPSFLMFAEGLMLQNQRKWPVSMSINKKCGL